MNQIAQKTFIAELVREGLWGADALGKHESTMTLYACDAPGRAFIEWDIPSLEFVEEIGLWFNVQKNLLDYDGVFSLPKEAIELLREHGFSVSKEFTNEDANG